MRTLFHVTAASIALIGMCLVVGFQPASGRNLKRNEIKRFCNENLIACLGLCDKDTRACVLQNNKCNVSYYNCLHSGGIFMDPQQSGNPPKHEKPIVGRPVHFGGAKSSGGTKPPRYKHPVHFGNLKPHYRGTNLKGGNGYPVTIMRTEEHHSGSYK